MKYIDLDQPSRTDSAGAASAKSQSDPSEGLESPFNERLRARTNTATDFNFSKINLAAPIPQQAPQGMLMAGVLQRVIGAVEALVGSQQQATSQLADKLGAFATKPSLGTQKPPTPNQQGHKPAESARANYAPWGRYEKKPESETPQPVQSMVSRYQPKPAAVKMGSPDSETEVRQMDDKSRKITNHENKHAAILRDSGTGVADAKPQLTQKQGPDGRQYAVAGEVNTDLRPVPGNPKATEHKAEAVYRSAIGDTDRSESDNQAARQALFSAQEARQAKSQQPAGNDSGPMESPHNERKPIRMASPYSVKMRNPLAAAGALLARGAAAASRVLLPAAVRTIGPRTMIGRGIRRGMIASKRMGRRISRAFNRPPQEGGVVNATVDALGLLNPAFGMLTKGVKLADAEFTAMAQKLKNFSPALSQQATQNSINRLNQNMQQGQRLGGGLAQYEKQKGRIEIAAGNIQADVISLFLPIATGIANSIATMMEILSAISAVIVKGFKAMGELVQLIIDNVPFLKRMLGFVGSIDGWIKQWKPPEIEADLNLKNLDQFFNMGIPAPNQPAQIQGPKINMAMPGFLP